MADGGRLWCWQMFGWVMHGHCWWCWWRWRWWTVLWWCWRKHHHLCLPCSCNVLPAASSFFTPLSSLLLPSPLHRFISFSSPSASSLVFFLLSSLPSLDNLDNCFFGEELHMCVFLFLCLLLTSYPSPSIKLLSPSFLYSISFIFHSSHPHSFSFMLLPFFSCLSSCLPFLFSYFFLLHVFIYRTNLYFTYTLSFQSFFFHFLYLTFPFSSFFTYFLHFLPWPHRSFSFLPLGVEWSAVWPFLPSFLSPNSSLASVSHSYISFLIFFSHPSHLSFLSRRVSLHFSPFILSLLPPRLSSPSFFFAPYPVTSSIIPVLSTCKTITYGVCKRPVTTSHYLSSLSLNLYHLFLK